MLMVTVGVAKLAAGLVPSAVVMSSWMVSVLVAHAEPKVEGCPWLLELTVIELTVGVALSTLTVDPVMVPLAVPLVPAWFLGVTDTVTAPFSVDPTT